MPQTCFEERSLFQKVHVLWIFRKRCAATQNKICRRSEFLIFYLGLIIHQFPFCIFDDFWGNDDTTRHDTTRHDTTTTTTRKLLILSRPGSHRTQGSNTPWGESLPRTIIPVRRIRGRAFLRVYSMGIHTIFTIKQIFVSTKENGFYTMY